MIKIQKWVTHMFNAKCGSHTKTLSHSAWPEDEKGHEHRHTQGTNISKVRRMDFK